MTDTTAAYFAKFKGLLGSRQLPGHLVSVPRWWTLRDAQGATPLMRALVCKGASPFILRLPGAEHILDAVDNEGHNLWFHLFSHHPRWGQRNTPAWLENWMDPLSYVPPRVSPQTNRGWMIEMACREPRYWGSFLKAPAGPSQKMWTNITSGPAHLWWLSSEEDARSYLSAITQRFPFSEDHLRDLHRFIELTLPYPFPDWMPQALQDALHLPGWLLAEEEDEEAVRLMHQEGRHFLFSQASHEALAALQGSASLPRHHVARCLAANNAVVLDTRIPTAKVSVFRRPRI